MIGKDSTTAVAQGLKHGIRRIGPPAVMLNGGAHWRLPIAFNKMVESKCEPPKDHAVALRERWRRFRSGAAGDRGEQDQARESSHGRGRGPPSNAPRLSCAACPGRRDDDHRRA